jgi:transposase
MKRAVRQIDERIATLDEVVLDTVVVWCFGPVVDAVRALRGVNTTIAATLVAEIGDINRFSNPRQLMVWLGLVPSEHSSGSSVRRGRITRTGNALARTMMVEASWSYRHPAKEGHPYSSGLSIYLSTSASSAGKRRLAYANGSAICQKRVNCSQEC